MPRMETRKLSLLGIHLEISTQHTCLIIRVKAGKTNTSAHT